MLLNMSKKNLLLTDNKVLFNKFLNLLDEINVSPNLFNFACSPQNNQFDGIINISQIKIKEVTDELITRYDKIFSLHSKQMFPKKLVENITCINIHPGFNPFNRGWYPQVFSIINNGIIGATIHIMDEQLDHGKIIDRVEVKKEIWDTSETLYDRILDAEILLIKRNMLNILNDNYKLKEPEEEGKLYTKKDFNQLCKIDLEQIGKFEEFYNLLRALSHGNHKNAYFITEENKKVFIKLNILLEDE